MLTRSGSLKDVLLLKWECTQGISSPVQYLLVLVSSCRKFCHMVNYDCNTPGVKPTFSCCKTSQFILSIDKNYITNHLIPRWPDKILFCNWYHSIISACYYFQVFRLRKRATHTIPSEVYRFYIVNLSVDTIIYKVGTHMDILVYGMSYTPTPDTHTHIPLPHPNTIPSKVFYFYIVNFSADTIICKVVYM